MSDPSVNSHPRTFAWARTLTIKANCYGRCVRRRVVLHHITNLLSSSARGSNMDLSDEGPCTNPLHYIIDNKLGICESSLSGWCISHIGDFYLCSPNLRSEIPHP